MYGYRRGTWARAAAGVVTVVLLAVAGCSGQPPIIQDPVGSTSSPPVTSPASSPPVSSSALGSDSAAASSLVASSSAVATPSSDPAPSSPSGNTWTSASPPPPASATPSISAKEAADRKAAEQAWSTYNTVAGSLWKKPAGTWKPTLSKYAVEPILTEALKSLQAGAKAGKGNYGEPVHHPYWLVPIYDAVTANMWDCVDASHTGSVNAKTGKKLTVGVPHQNTRIVLVREKDGWKVADVTYLVNQPCPGQKLSASQEASSEAAARSSAKASA